MTKPSLVSGEGKPMEVVPASRLLAVALKQLQEMANREAADIIEVARETEGKLATDGWVYDQMAHTWTRPKKEVAP